MVYRSNHEYWLARPGGLRSCSTLPARPELLFASMSVSVRAPGHGRSPGSQMTSSSKRCPASGPGQAGACALPVSGPTTEYRDVDLASSLGGIAVIAVSLLEVLIPLQRRNGWTTAHLVPNLMLTLVTFAIGASLNVGMLLSLIAVQRGGIGLLNLVALPGWIEIGVAILVL